MSRTVQVKGDHPQGLALCTRIYLMQSMEKEFGKVAYCKKPPTTGDPETDVAFVQFQNQEDAERAVTALRKGLTLSTTWQGITLDIRGDWKPGEFGKGSKPSSSFVKWQPENVEDSRSFLTRNASRSRTDRQHWRRPEEDIEDTWKCPPESLRVCVCVCALHKNLFIGGFKRSLKRRAHGTAAFFVFAF
ncbi:unnamed protein product [Durusdinium trenchii]|uniref:RRM domain-containing protein n=1 Tax=Durusdinium trenchii TaxID=1381693 RepID=A0ABP0R8Q9_9DINO